MNTFNRLTLKYPITSTMLLILLSIVFSQIGAVLLDNAFEQVSRETFAMYTRYGTAMLTIWLLFKLGALRSAGISAPVSQWGHRWYLAVLPVMLVGCMNFSGVQWQALQFAWQEVVFWLFANLATGVFEETMMRAMALFLLYRAWQHQQNGLFRAAWGQAVIFGVIHLVNLVNGVSVDVFAQVVYATVIGFAFAGIVVYTGSIWPAAVAHGFINAVANINQSFVPDYVSDGTPVIYYALFTLVIVVIAALPGHVMLKRSQDSFLQRGLA